MLGGQIRAYSLIVFSPLTRFSLQIQLGTSQYISELRSTRDVLAILKYYNVSKLKYGELLAVGGGCYYVIFLPLSDFCKISRKIYMKWGLAHAFLHQAKFNLSFAGYFGFLLTRRCWGLCRSKVEECCFQERCPCG